MGDETGHEFTVDKGGVQTRDETGYAFPVDRDQTGGENRA
jgi:hypothetical protein